MLILIIPSLSCALESAGRLVNQTQTAQPRPWSFRYSRSGWGLIICISSQGLGGAEATGGGTPFENHPLANGLQILQPNETLCRRLIQQLLTEKLPKL